MKEAYWKKLKIGVIAAGFLISAVCYTKTEDGSAVLLSNDGREAEKVSGKTEMEKAAGEEITADTEKIPGTSQPASDKQSKANPSALQIGEVQSEELETFIRQIVQEELAALREQEAAKQADERDVGETAEGKMPSETFSSAQLNAGGAKREGDAAASLPAMEAAPPDERININTASKEELMQLKGIGAARADAIISYRATYGGFHDIEEIMNIPGIKEASFEKIKDQICVR